jgi:hypothetical protein
MIPPVQSKAPLRLPIDGTDEMSELSDAEPAFLPILRRCERVTMTSVERISARGSVGAAPRPRRFADQACDVLVRRARRLMTSRQPPPRQRCGRSLALAKVGFQT